MQTATERVTTPLLMNINEVAEALRVSRFTVSRWAAEGRLQRIKIGGRVLFDPVDVRRFIETAKQGSALPQPVAV